MNLFLTEAPLLLDVRSADAVPLPAPARPPRLLYPAQLQTHKNHRALVRGVEVLRRSGTDVVLLCPGSDFDAELSDEIMEVVAASGCEALFEFLGRVDDDALVDLYSRCDGVIVPSVAEGGAYVPLRP